MLFSFLNSPQNHNFHSAVFSDSPSHLYSPTCRRKEKITVWDLWLITSTAEMPSTCFHWCSCKSLCTCFSVMPQLVYEMLYINDATVKKMINRDDSQRFPEISNKQNVEKLFPWKTGYDSCSFNNNYVRYEKAICGKMYYVIFYPLADSLKSKNSNWYLQ